MSDQTTANDPMMHQRRMLLLGMLAAPVAAGAAGQGAPELYESAGDRVGDKSLAQQVRELVDKEEIRDLIARYAHRVAHGVSIADLYADDGAYITHFPGRPMREVRGRAALDKNFARVSQNPVKPLPMIHNILIKVDGDTATGICSNELRMTENGRSMIGSGYYEDEYRREKAGWRFVRREITFIHWVPITEGWAEQAAMASLATGAITAEKLHGTWMLTKVTEVDAAGKLRPHLPYGPTPMGRLVLNDSGRMIAMVSDGRTSLPPSAERAYASYCGNFVIENNVLKTKVDAAFLPRLVGTVQTRDLEVRDGELALLPPKHADGSQHALYWVRTGPA